MATTTIITKPTQSEYDPYMETYISLVKGEHIFEEMFQSYIDTMELVTSLDPETLHYRYAPGKWTILGIMQHLIDTERIFAYRALRFARKDTTELPGYDQEQYTKTSNADNRDINDMVREFSLVRSTTIELFKSFDGEMLAQKGVANGKSVTVKALLFAIAGHEMHHRNIIQERYMNG
jgi:uncharacterized damage-inducible protein DinB